MEITVTEQSTVESDELMEKHDITFPFYWKDGEYDRMAKVHSEKEALRVSDVGPCPSIGKRQSGSEPSNTFAMAMTDLAHGNTDNIISEGRFLPFYFEIQEKLDELAGADSIE